MFVKRDGDRVVTEGDRAVDEVGRAIRNPVYWIVGGMGMKVDFEHWPLPLSVSVPTSAAEAFEPNPGAKTASISFGLKLFSV